MLLSNTNENGMKIEYLAEKKLFTRSKDTVRTDFFPLYLQWCIQTWFPEVLGLSLVLVKPEETFHPFTFFSEGDVCVCVESWPYALEDFKRPFPFLMDVASSEVEWNQNM